MKGAWAVALALACWGVRAQAQAGGSSQTQPSRSAGSGQSSAPNAPASGSSAGGAQKESNPFPEDINSIPVMPSADSPGAAPSAFESDAAAAALALPSDDSDPVRSPDDPAAASATGQEAGTSDSSTGLDQLLEPPPDTGRHHRKGEDDQIDAAFPHDGPKKDINIGEYYLQTGDWQGALSRYESAMVQDPENPEVYWGLAEAQRHLGQYAEARANYLKVVDYDPDSRHGKDARKILKQPEIANAPAVSGGTSTARPRQ